MDLWFSPTVYPKVWFIFMNEQSFCNKTGCQIQEKRTSNFFHFAIFFLYGKCSLCLIFFFFTYCFQMPAEFLLVCQISYPSEFVQLSPTIKMGKDCVHMWGKKWHHSEAYVFLFFVLLGIGMEQMTSQKKEDDKKLTKYFNWLTRDSNLHDCL